MHALTNRNSAVWRCVRCARKVAADSQPIPGAAPVLYGVEHTVIEFQRMDLLFGIRLALKAGDSWLSATAASFLPISVARPAPTLCTLSHGRTSIKLQYCCQGREHPGSNGCITRRRPFWRARNLRLVAGGALRLILQESRCGRWWKGPVNQCRL